MSNGELNLTVIEYLGIQAARLTATNHPVALVTLRLDPGTSFTPTNGGILKPQLIRFRNDIDALLNDDESWLYEPDDGSPHVE